MERNRVVLCNATAGMYLAVDPTAREDTLRVAVQ